ncbi:DUF1697 domain-containing protein [Aeromicrobium sp. Leaf272]|uniref:DUF1697 domain-containing protein n=1 Tax=Aeromicrobium sp. Leaf272 TaxID=1736317 RepID=UPI00070073B6|nr:DUF1697 domain-containing protein [Aeromicrobium sp. Leaf272]KQP26995.1 hypothetical protein ASF38_08625 [Aeromicrobium sp. Leaf272]
MTRIHLLRAVNVGGAKLPMAELRDLASGLGAADVSTYIASGNLLCTPPGDPATFDRALEQAVQERFGFFREVVSRDVDELRAALQAHPFEVVEAKFSHVYFLLAEPAPDAVQAFESTDWGGDEVRVIGRDLHIRYSDGVAGTRLTPARIAKLLGHHGTGRNLLTVAKLVELADA